MMSANSALQQLRDIHLPPPISSWPIAPGWQLIFMLTLILLCYATYYFYKQKQRNRAIRFALQQLKSLHKLAEHNPNNINIAATVSTLIRRTALYYYGRDRIAGLTGMAWLAFLNETGQTTTFTEQTAHLLIDAPYRKTPSKSDVIPLLTITKKWLHTIAKRQEK